MSVFGIPTAAAAPTATTTPSSAPTATSEPTPTPPETAEPTATGPATPPPSPTPTPTPSPTPSPKPSPSTPTPTPAPSETAEPEPEPEPTAPGTDEPEPEPEPSAPGTDEPKPEPDPEPTETKSPDEIYEEALEGAQTKAVAEAQRLIAIVMAAIGDAEAQASDATAAADAARAASDEAARQLKITEESVARTQREIGTLAEQQETTRQTIGAVAAEAYQGGGTTSTMNALFSSETPSELTDRYVDLDILLRANDHALGTMAESAADLRNAEVTLDDQLQRGRQQAAEAQEKAASTAKAENAAAMAQATLEDQNAKLAVALQLAEDAKLEDYQKYMEMIGESTELGKELQDKTDYGPGFGTGDFVRPATGDFTSPYGQRRHPILGYVKMHTGLDFGRGDGTIYAADSGTVIKAEWNNAYGYMVVVDHGEIDGNRVSTMYAHQPGLSVSVGQKVEKGQVIGKIGSTGYSTGPHLHFEVYVNGEHTDPMPWVENAPSPT